MAATTPPYSRETAPASVPLLAPLRAARKWARIYSVFVQDALAYRAVAFVWILTDTIPALVMPLLWLASYNGRAQIAGFAPAQITAYYLVLLFITNLVQCHVMWEMAQDIKEGRFSAYLIRPFSYGAMQYLSFLAWRVMRTILFLPVFFLAAFFFRSYLRWEDYQIGWPFFASVVLGHFVSFFVTYCVGLLALYFVETRSLFNFWYMPLIIFSGQLAPLAMFPPQLQVIARLLPFRYTVALPTEIFLGRLSPAQIQQGLMYQLLWIALAVGIGNLLWRHGLKRFTGVGL
jgi:ABC-2 type transport system permease protein